MSQLVIVTGANRGLGLGVAEDLLTKGHRVILTSRSETKGRKEVERLKGKFEDVYFQRLDVEDSESIKKCFEWVFKEFGVLDILINNAGINYDTWHDSISADLVECRKTMDVNFFGPWKMCQIFSPLLKKSKKGRIVNVSSGSGALGGEEAGTPGYSASKAALNMLTIKLAHDLRPDNIKVNAVCPGWVRTEMGGSNATRSIPEGAASVVWAALVPDDGPSGGFFRDGNRLAW